LVRPGLAIYGLHPRGKVDRANEFKLKPALSLKAKIVNLKNTKPLKEFLTTTPIKLKVTPSLQLFRLVILTE